MNNNSTSTIGDLEAGIADALLAIREGVKLPEGLENLKYLAPPLGFNPKVSFRRAGDESKIRDDASKDHWSPETALLQIEFVAQASLVNPVADEELGESHRSRPAAACVGEAQSSRFAPVQISGQPLSSTVLQDRR